MNHKNIFLEIKYNHNHNPLLCIALKLEFRNITESGVNIIFLTENNLTYGITYSSKTFKKTKCSFKVDDKITNTEPIYPNELMYRIYNDTVVLILSAKFDENMENCVCVSVMDENMDIFDVCSNELRMIHPLLYAIFISAFEENLRMNKLKIACGILC